MIETQGCFEKLWFVVSRSANQVRCTCHMHWKWMGETEALRTLHLQNPPQLSVNTVRTKMNCSLHGVTKVWAGFPELLCGLGESTYPLWSWFQNHLVILKTLKYDAGRHREPFSLGTQLQLWLWLTICISFDCAIWRKAWFPTHIVANITALFVQ